MGSGKCFANANRFEDGQWNSEQGLVWPCRPLVFHFGGAGGLFDLQPYFGTMPLSALRYVWHCVCIACAVLTSPN